MAKSSSNDDLCDHAIQIIEAFPAYQNIRGVLIPFDSKRSSSSSNPTSPRCNLGPYFTTYPEELSLVFPFHSHFAYSYQRKQMKWGEWDTFSIPGYMTPMVADVFALMCLRPMGAFVHNLMAIGELYRAMFLLSTEPKQSHSGPIWLIQMWAYSYFPSITPEFHPTIVPWSYGEAWMHTRYPEEVPSYPTCFKLFSDPSRKRSPKEFMPFEEKRYGYEDFQKFSSQDFFKGDAAWGACLHSRDLVVIRATNTGVEAYCPSLVAWQFGLIQLLPVPPTWTNNKDWSSRVSIPKDEAQGLCDSSTSSTNLHFWKKIGGDPSSQKFATAENAAFQKAKGSVRLHAHTLQLPTSSKQGACTSTKRKTPETTTKKPRVIEATPDASINEIEPLVKELDDATTLSTLIKSIGQQKQVLGGIIEAQQALEAEDRRIAQEHKEAIQFAAVVKVKNKAVKAKRKCLKAKEEEEKRRAEKAEKERIAEIGRKLEVKKNEKADAQKKKQEEMERRKEKEGVEKKKKKEKEKKKEVEKEKKEEEATKEKAEKRKAHVVPKEKKMVEEVGEVATMPKQEAVTSSVEVATPLVSGPTVLKGLGNINKLLEDVSLTLQQCQTPTKTSSIITSLKPTKEQLQVAIKQLKELLKQPINAILLDASLVDQFLQSVHAESQGLVRGVELIFKAEQDLQTLQLKISDLEMLPLMS
uniref:Aminotransferase-like plant mobile domain-containing protein n=1 Tax=Fagus sylvatica TaxID=28930 RepID=A0A2N9F7Z1_FAGSY